MTDYQVTYFNPLSERRCVLIDAIDHDTAEAVVARFGDKREPAMYLPELRIEEQPAAAA